MITYYKVYAVSKGGNKMSFVMSAENADMLEKKLRLKGIKLIRYSEFYRRVR